MNADEIFVLATIAHGELKRLMEPLDANLQIILDFDTKHPGVQVWVFANAPVYRALAHRTGIKTLEELDELVAKVKKLASIPV
jgi:hypothetical protein